MDTTVILVTTFDWLFGRIIDFFESTHLPTIMIEMGNGIFNSTIGFCTGYLTNTPAYNFQDAWQEMRNLATGNIAIGIANDLFVIFFLISLIEYATSIRTKPEVEDIFKMFARSILAQYVIFNFSSLVGGFSTVIKTIVDAIAPEATTILSSTLADPSLRPMFTTSTILPTVSGAFGWLIWIVNLILALVYMVMLVIVSFKIITGFFERYIWFFLAIPFGPPALATIAGTGKFSSTAKAYTRFFVSICVEMIAFAVMVNLIKVMAGSFSTYLGSWITSAITDVGDGWDWIVGYLSNLCLVSMIYGAFNKLDNRIEKMYGL